MAILAPFWAAFLKAATWFTSVTTVPSGNVNDVMSSILFVVAVTVIPATLVNCVPLLCEL